ncbi:MAG: DNA-directed RNA polymerase subunit B [Candidatus Woesearchaeota archaeon]|nr:DNA-directed RNA polymerase subunit B [Candidatus Woesearchaeota archaeon]
MGEVYLNGKFIGYAEKPKDFAAQVIQKRRESILSSEINVFYDDKTRDVHIETFRGRLRRPLIIVKNGKSLLTSEHVKKLQNNELSWEDMIKQGVIEYLDAAEEENSLVAFFEKDLTPEHTHLEIMPMTIVSLCTSLVPYANHDQSARLNAGSKNQKQALGMYATNFPLRMDMDTNILHYPQIPIVQTMMTELSHYEKHPAGQNIVVAMMSFKGYNMEDSVVINKGSLDRGFGRSTYFRPAAAEEIRYPGGLTDDICVPDKEVKGYKSEDAYKYLEEDGIISTEIKVKEDDVLIGKTSPPRFLSSLEQFNISASERRESSVSVKHGEEGIVDFVLITENMEGNKFMQVNIRDQRIPEIGDKFTSRHGQKGVVGLIVNSTDMPFSASGIVPDLLFSPHGIPSRMTIGHLIEAVGGKVGALSGRFIDGTTFDSEPEEQLRSALTAFGFRENGTETLYNGETGEIFEARIFIGEMYYLKLKHMVANKIHARARGPIQLLTRQPTEGRAKEGGLRLGEMEKDCFVAHGTSLLLKERFDSDRTVVPVCEKCGLIAIADRYRKKSFCPVCGEESTITDIEMSYAFKLLLDEMKSFCIYPRLVLKSKYE